MGKREFGGHIILIDIHFLYHSQMSGPSQHKYRYKNQGLDSAEMRRRREEEGVQLRKQKREQQLAKRRNVNDVAAGLGEEEGVESSMNQASNLSI